MSNRETRTLPGFTLERRTANGIIGRLTGYAAVFNRPTLIGGMFREQVALARFAGALVRDDIHALVEHGFNMIIGRNRAGPEPP